MPADALAGVMDDIMTQMASSQLSRKQKRSSQVQTPKRRSIRIEKPRSVQPSPNMKERRRTLTTFQPHASLADHYQRMFAGVQGSQSSEEVSAPLKPSRPVSWHPSSTFTDMDSSLHSAAMTDNTHNFIPHYDGSDETFLGSSQQTSMPFSTSGDTALAWSGDNVYNSTIPMHQHSDWSIAIEDEYSSPSGLPSYASALDQVSWYPTHYENVQFNVPQYQLNTFVDQDAPHVYNQPSQQSYNHLTALTGHADVPLERSGSRELVGMGLYDPPGTSLLQYGATGRTSLKLEESWQPPSNLLMEDAASQAGDNSSDEEEELPRPAESAFTPNPVVELSGQGLFDENGDDNVTNEWWYQQLKQPTAHVTGFGHGWLQV